MSEIQGKSNGRLLSLDFYRGLTMFLLIAEFSHLFTFLVSPQFEGSLIYTIGNVAKGATETVDIDLKIDDLFRFITV